MSAATTFSSLFFFQVNKAQVFRVCAFPVYGCHIGRGGEKLLVSFEDLPTSLMAQLMRACVSDPLARGVVCGIHEFQPRRPESARQPAALLRRTFFLKSKRCGHTFATAT